MKAMLAALLLMFQLQPVLGSVACLGLSDSAARQECRMPDHARPQGTGVGAAANAAESCHLATFCMPATLAIPELLSSFETAVPLREGVGTIVATVPRGLSPAPPFRPPRV